MNSYEKLRDGTWWLGNVLGAVLIVLALGCIAALVWYAPVWFWYTVLGIAAFVVLVGIVAYFRMADEY